MKSSIMLHFIRVYTVCKGQKDVQTKNTIFLKIIIWHPWYVQWTIPSLLYQTRRKNSLVYKGLTYIFFPVIQINIKRCRNDGCDTRVHDLKALGYRWVDNCFFMYTYCPLPFRITPRIFLQFIKPEGPCWSLELCKYVTIAATIGNICLNMTLNKFFVIYLVTPPPLTSIIVTK